MLRGANTNSRGPATPDLTLLGEVTATLGRGFTVADVAARYRVGEDKVRGWIKHGLLRAINTSDIACARPRYVVPPEALAEFERMRSVAPPPKPVRQRRRSGERDWFAG